MLKTMRPEAVGIDSRDVYDFLFSLKKRGSHLHSLLLMRGDKIFLEAYWAPFERDLPHRMYSVTKSFASVAVGLCLEDGLIDLDRPIAEYFPEKSDTLPDGYLKRQTVRQMLTMTTTGHVPSWFEASDPDRTHFYFTDMQPRHPAGTLWEYDSAGSQVLSALVEKVSGRSLFDLLNERIFRHLECFHDAKILKTRNGDSWGDSAMICTTRDLATFARFVLNYGVWNGQRLMNEEYLRTATSALVSNGQSGHTGMFDHGYGYQFWRTEEDGFLLNGMGDQIAICMPKQDLILVSTADNQGNEFTRPYLTAQFMDLIVAKAKDAPLPQNDEEYDRLQALTEGLSLYALHGEPDSPMREQINDAVYECPENTMGWESFSFHFENAEEGELRYHTTRGVMTLPFYVNRNRFGTFPEEGYSREAGGVRTTDDHRYRDAVSLAWKQENKILLFVQIIDEYFGNCSMNFIFKDNEAVVKVSKMAEDFLWEYRGEIVAKRKA